jgi:stringent starvation protein B
MTPNRPYLIRALREWILDNGLTPHLLVNTKVQGVQVPPHYVENGKIILNISPSATHHLQLGNEYIEFGARFSGTPVHIQVPTNAVLAIYARENGVGMAFQEEGPEDKPPAGDSDRKSNSRPALRVVK